MTVRFFFPYRAPSGVCSAFARMAEELADRCAIRTTVLDYADGYLRRSLNGNSRVIQEEFKDGRPVTLPPDDVLVLQASPPAVFRPELTFHPPTRLILWQLHPLNFVPNLIPLKRNPSWTTVRPALYRSLLTAFHSAKRKRIVEFIHLAGRSRALFFYEQPSLRITEQLLGCTIQDPILLPVPVATPDAPIRHGRQRHDALHVAWVGRLYDFKIHILVHILQRFSNYARQHHTSVLFHVIGDGPERSRLDTLDFEHRFFTIQRTGDLDGGSLHQYLSSKVDLITAMGTSAMEGALIGLPAILLDLSYGPVKPGYRFRWLYDTKGFDLGHAITDEDCDAGKDNLPEMIAALRKDYAALGQKCFDYCVNNHSVRRIADRFIELVRSSSLKFGDIPAATRRKTLPRRLHERYAAHRKLR